MVLWWPLAELEHYTTRLHVLEHDESIELLAAADLSHDDGIVPLLLGVSPAEARAQARIVWPMLLERARRSRCPAPVALAVLVYSTNAVIWWHTDRNGVAFSTEEREKWHSLTPN